MEVAVSNADPNQTAADYECEDCIGMRERGHHHHYLSHRQWMLLYLARHHAEDPRPPTVYEMVATVIAGLASLVALVALGALAGFVLFALVVAFLT